MKQQWDVDISCTDLGIYNQKYLFALTEKIIKEQGPHTHAY